MRSPWFDPRSPDVELRHVLQEKNNNINTRDLRVTGALLYQLSYEATHWERGQLSSYLP